MGASPDGATFAKLAHRRPGQCLKGLESGELQLDGGVDGKAFFTMLLQNTKEGYFSDPIYGGNKDMGGVEDDRLSGRALRLQGLGHAPRRARSVPPVGFKGRPGWRKG